VGGFAVMENFSPLEHRKNFFESVRLWLCVLVAALILPLASRAQDTGYISGTVTDKSGAAVVGAEVVLTNVGGSLTRTTTTNADGLYVIAGLPGATYNLVITAKGFQKFSANKIVLNIAEKSRVDVQLTVGAVTEVVEVTGEAAAQVETSSSDLSSTITGKQVENLVLNGRNFTQLVTLAPGVVNQTGQDEGTVGVYGNVAYSMNGGRTEYNNWELDGGDNMDNGSNATLNVYPNPEAISEFKILTSNYGAQYGRNGSGTVEVETKSGTTSFHGSAFEYLRNDMFNARPWDVAGGPNPSYKKHDYGYTIGGPVYIPHHYNADKKKTFFFFSEEWRKEKNPSTSLHNVPSDLERTGDFTILCTHDPDDCPSGPAVITPSPVGQALLALIPHANTTNGTFDCKTCDGSPIPAVRQTVSLPTTWREELFRIDHKLTEKYQLTFRYIHDSWKTTTPNALWGNGSNFEDIQTAFVGPGTSFVARLNANITPTLLNEFVASYTADHIFLTAINNPALPSGFTSEMGTLFPSQSVPFGDKLPAISLGGNTAYGGCLTADTGYFPWNNANPTYTYRDNLTKIAGKHTLTMGAYLAFAQKNEDNSPYVQGILSFDTGSSVTTGNSFADLLLGNIARYQQSLQTIKYYNRYKIVEPYFQDDWRMTKRLTLNLGMRLSFFGTYRERYQRAFNFDPITAAKNAANQPTVDDGNGDATGFAGALVPATQGGNASGNPFYGIVQCGGRGGTFPEPGFPNATVGPSSNAGCLKGHLFNPAPRIGFAFDPKGDGKMAIRGGYGIFFEHTNGNEAGTESLEGSPPLGLTQSVFNVTGYGNIGGGGAAIPFFPLSVFSIPNQARWPYVQQWHLDVQKDLPSHIVGTISYVGSKGTHLTLQRDINQLQPFTGTNPFAAGQPITDADCANIVDPTTGLPSASATLGNGTPVPAGALNNLFVACGNSADLIRTAFPAFSTITSLEPQANSIYHALQATAHRTVGDLQLSVAYTYSHSLDDSSDRYDGAFVNSYNVANNRASSGFDQRHSLAVSYIYALPFFKGAGFAHHALGGWQISGITIAQTGTPFSVGNDTTFGDNAGVGNGVGTGSRPDLIGNPHSGFTANQEPGVFGPLWFNPAAFAIPTGLTFGNVGRNTLYLPGRVNFDFGLFKRFSFGESRAIDFRWENFNIFNHTQFNSVSSGLGDSDFLHANDAHAPRRMQFALRLQF
jgi:carboxypeptidase family protein